MEIILKNSGVNNVIEEKERVDVLSLLSTTVAFSFVQDITKHNYDRTNIFFHSGLYRD